jgi:MoaA/NifB/PqqE/SkfB family radical SAM enzyme
MKKYNKKSVINFFKNKPRAVKKYTNYIRHTKRSGLQSVLRGIQLNYSNKCNFRCKHCFTNSSSNQIEDDAGKLNICDIERIADEADKLGIWEIDIQGGEPLMLPELENIVKAFKPERFYIFITTNGWMLDKETAQRLKDWGLDRVTVSIDDFDKEKHDNFRGKKGSFKKALRALRNVHAVGLRANINVTVGHFNAKSKSLQDLIEYAQERGYMVSLLPATPTGAWHQNLDVMLDSEDIRHLEKLRQANKQVYRDLWSFQDNANLGCPAVNIAYINPYGDVLPCPYIHIKLGNIRSEPLESILERGFRINYFRNYQKKCLVGENIKFASKYLKKDMSILKPLYIDEVFSSEDILDLHEIDIIGNSKC